MCEGQLQQKHPTIEQTQSKIVLFFPIPSVVLSCYTFLNLHHSTCGQEVFPRVLDLPPGTFTVKPETGPSVPRASPEPFEVPRTSLGLGRGAKGRVAPVAAPFPPTIVEDDDETATRLAEMLSNKVLHL